MADKLQIYLCDFVHDYIGMGSFSFPLNIGYISAYVKHFHESDVEFKLFKYPSVFFDHIKKQQPDVLGFSNYTWNQDLNRKAASFAKKIKPDLITIFGGPNLNYHEKGIADFFQKTPEADFYTPFQGETPSLNLIRKMLESTSMSHLKSGPMDNIIYWDHNTNKAVYGPPLPRIKNPDTIPSPYLTGTLDEFFETPLIPIIETNRGCPYTCTYCAQGFASYNRMEFFSIDRVKEEIRYIAERTKNTNIMFVADSNFGIHKRDIEIAQFMSEIREETGYPRQFSMNWAKNQPKILNMGKVLSNSSSMTISLQTLSEPVLKNIKRNNINLQVFKDIINEINEHGGVSSTEIILGLPGETVKSHIDTLRELFDMDLSHIIAYNALVLEGTEMAEQRDLYKIKSKFRLSDGCWGIYEGMFSFDTEEGVMSTDTMTEDQLLSFRKVHWLIWLMWNYRFYYDYLKFLQQLGINPIDFIYAIIDNLYKDTGAARSIIDSFDAETKAEWHDSHSALHDYFSQQDNFDKLVRGELGGKLNAKYMWKLLLEAGESFQKLVFSTGLSMCNSLGIAAAPQLHADIEKYLSARQIDFNADPDDLGEDHIIALSYDIPEWKRTAYHKPLDTFKLSEPMQLHFYLPQEQKLAIKQLIQQYAHPNKAVTYRKMSEHMNIDDLFLTSTIS